MAHVGADAHEEGDLRTCLSAEKQQESRRADTQGKSPRADKQDVPLGDGYVLRHLAKEDYHKGFTQLMSNLSDTCHFSEAQFVAALDQRANCITMVVEHECSRQLVASASMVLEQKFLHECACVGHIEDVVTHPEHRGKGLAKKILESLQQEAEDLGCYKVILNCKGCNVPVYTKCGWLESGEVQMRLDIRPVTNEMP
eukprot:GEMP01069519.1.p1 GENE.GEMP01069519.1~~GEMP01069519.1.p1  ORF type:complete len:198 (+),score=39.37 GEMP01069519.1:39-632(+)